jgi:AcrR family transcriptional regulator
MIISLFLLLKVKNRANAQFYLSIVQLSNSSNGRGDMLHNFESLAEFRVRFPYQGMDLYHTLFIDNRDRIKTAKAKFATQNLEKIFVATFKLAPQMGFSAMTLRDLCQETGLSMGGIYNTIENKETIAIMIKNLIQRVSSEIIQHAMQQPKIEMGLQSMIRHHVYASSLLQTWFSFLFFETHSLSEPHRTESLAIEQAVETALLNLILANHPVGSLKLEAIDIAQMLLALMQERYLKPWKYPHSADEMVEETVQRLLNLLRLLTK